ncbi:hypothetical protein [Isoptericola sp. NPDC060185]|uniref:endo-beta-N-acetylglucosaminidase n=1 Tax=Isoptericola sp. NPDC060185 TaxID=3347065 RepID=UPI00364C8D2F
MAAASDTLPWEGDSAKGPNQPYQHGYNPDGLLDWDPRTDSGAELLRARVPLQERADTDPSTQRDPSLPADTQMLALSGDYGNASFESHPYTNEFSQHLFSFWQYTDVYAAWHGMPTEGVPEDLYDPSAIWTQRWFEFGAVNLPNPGYTNAAHRNGVRSLGCIFFSDNDRGSQTYSELLVRDANGDFPAAGKLADIAEYFGFDGWFINQEQSKVAAEDVDDYQDFLAALRAEGLYVQWYDSVDAANGDKLYENEFTPRNSPFVRDAEKGDLADSIFLNYWWNPAKLTASAQHARSLGLDPRQTVFAGVEAGMYQFDQPYDLQDNLGADGTPMNAIATLGADFVHSDFADKTDDAAQSQVFDRERRWWTGSPTGTDATRPADGEWQGISSYVAERTAVTGRTFATTFNTGHGLGYWHEGELSSDAEWGNIGVQDLPVTWQWWVEAKDGADPLQVDYDYGPDYVAADRFGYEHLGAYEGGSSLAVSGDLASDNLLRLFKSDLEVSPGTDVELTYAKPSADDGSQLTLALVLASDPDRVIEVPVKRSGAQTDGWRTVHVDLSRFAGETITTFGLGFRAGDGPVADYQVNVGKIAVTDGRDHTPDRPRGFEIDRALTSTDELFLRWDLADYDDVARYDVYADGEYLGGVYDDVLYAKHFTRSRGTLELVAVGHDGSESTPAVLRYDFSRGPGDVTAEASEDGTVTVSWKEPVASPTVVTLAAEDAGRRGYEEQTVARRGSTEVTFRRAPVDGGGLVATVAPRSGTAVSATGSFADTQIEAYPASAAALEGTSLRLTRPALADWHTLTVYEDGEPVPFDTTYSQGERPQMIRGRTTLPSLTRELASEHSEVVVRIEDYAGNVADTTLRAATR